MLCIGLEYIVQKRLFPKTDVQKTNLNASSFFLRFLRSEASEASERLEAVVEKTTARKCVRRNILTLADPRCDPIPYIATIETYIPRSATMRFSLGLGFGTELRSLSKPLVRPDLPLEGV
jgi:hypothetical protein